MLPDGDAADVAGADMADTDIMAESYTYNFLVYMILNEFNYS
jgi:hypothetical protein